MYISPGTAFEGMHVDTEVFRAQFLDDCKSFIGRPHEEAYKSKLAAELESYGGRLFEAAEAFAAPKGLQSLKEQRRPPSTDDADERAAHIAYWAAKWCLFWGRRGHGLSADW